MSGGRGVKLSKKGESRQRAIRRAVSAGKALGGLLVGFAATVAGCRERSPAHTIGRFPASSEQQHDNSMRFFRNRRAIPGEPPVPQPVETNAVTEDISKKRPTKQPCTQY